MNMTQGEVELPSRSPHERGNAECASAVESVARFVRGATQIDEDRAMREHLAVCSDCNEHYRQALVALARRTREERVARESRVESAPVARKKRPFFSAGDPRANRVRAVKLMLVVGLALVALERAFPSKPGSQAEVLAGTARIGTREIAFGDDGAPVRDGAWLTVGPRSRARLTLEGASFVLGPATQLLVQDPAKAVLRLDSGELWIDGAANVTTPWGCVQIARGRAHMSCERDDVLVESLDASVLAATSSGETELAPGTSVRLATLGP
jgi:hypothetical protein